MGLCTFFSQLTRCRRGGRVRNGKSHSPRIVLVVQKEVVPALFLFCVLQIQEDDVKVGGGEKKKEERIGATC